jgi:hypothetical protein
MAKIVSYTPQGIIDKALFNFDAMGGSNFKLSDQIIVSISNPFSNTQFLSGYSNNLAWSPDVSAAYWNNAQVANVNLILDTYKQFSNIPFTSALDNTKYTPVGAKLNADSDINISLIYRSNLAWSGMSSINENSFGYQGSELDIIEGGINTFKNAKVVIAEVSFNNYNEGGCNKDQILKKMIDLKFDYIMPVEKVMNDKNELIAESLLFIRP